MPFSMCNGLLLWESVGVHDTHCFLARMHGHTCLIEVQSLESSMVIDTPWFSDNLLRTELLSRSRFREWMPIVVVADEHLCAVWLSHLRAHVHSHTCVCVMWILCMNGVLAINVSFGTKRRRNALSKLGLCVFCTVISLKMCHFEKTEQQAPSHQNDTHATWLHVVAIVVAGCLVRCSWQKSNDLLPHWAMCGSI